MEIEDKALRFHLKIRVFGRGFDEGVSHSYCVDDTPFSISHPIGELYVDVRKVTFKQLRPQIQYNRTKHMDRRSMMFQEALFIMGRLPNLYDRPKLQWNKYLFGFLDRNSHNRLTVISADREEIPIVNLIGAADMEHNDIALVPLSQISEEEELNGAVIDNHVPELPIDEAALAEAITHNGSITATAADASTTSSLCS